MGSIPPIEKFGSRIAWEYHIWKELVRKITDTRPLGDAEKLMNTLITASERKQIINRAVAIALLKQGKTYSEIGEILWLSPTTISSIRKSVRDGGIYISHYTREKGKPRKITKISSYSSVYPKKKCGRGVILPHGKLVFPQRRRRII